MVSLAEARRHRWKHRHELRPSVSGDSGLFAMSDCRYFQGGVLPRRTRGLGEHSILRWLARTRTMPSGVGRPTSSCCRQQLSIQTGSRQYFLCVFAEGGNSRSWYELGCTHAKRHIQDQKAASRIRDFSQRRTVGNLRVGQRLPHCAILGSGNAGLAESCKTSIACELPRPNFKFIHQHRPIAPPIHIPGKPRIGYPVRSSGRPGETLERTFARHRQHDETV